MSVCVFRSKVSWGYPLYVCFQKQGVIGLPDTPVALHEINLEDLLPRYAPPVKPTGMLKLQLQFTEDRTTLNVIIIEVGRARCDSAAVENAHFSHTLPLPLLLSRS